MADEGTWLVVKASGLEAVLDPSVLAAEDTPLTDGSGLNRSDKLVAMAVARVRQAVVAGNRVPVSATAGTVPPEAEEHVLSLAAMALTASKPNLRGVVVGPSGIYDPFSAKVKLAEDWIKAVRGGQRVAQPDNPDPDWTSPSGWGDGEGVPTPNLAAVPGQGGVSVGTPGTTPGLLDTNTDDP